MSASVDDGISFKKMKLIEQETFKIYELNDSKVKLEKSFFIVCRVVLVNKK